MTLEAKRKLLQQQLDLRIQQLGLTHIATIEKSKELDGVILEMQNKLKGEYYEC